MPNKTPTYAEMPMKARSDYRSKRAQAPENEKKRLTRKQLRPSDEKQTHQK